MIEQQIQLKVFRYKQGWEVPTHQTFNVSVDDNTTLLVALQDIRRDQDPTLVLRHSCHHASCGTCGLKVNGREVLACVVKVLELGSSAIVVEPLDNLPLLSDLAVDMDGFYDRYSVPEMPILRQSEYLPNATPPEGIAQFGRYENCLECGICVSACPVAGSDPAYLGPAAMAAGWRVFAEPRESHPDLALNWVDNEHGCWRCHVAYECSEVCPSNVDPAGSIMALRRELTKDKLGHFFRR